MVTVWLILWLCVCVSVCLCDVVVLWIELVSVVRVTTENCYFVLDGDLDLPVKRETLKPWR